MNGSFDPRRRQGGLGLVEMVVSIVIISVAVAGVLLTFATTVRRSADPQLLEQAHAVAEGYLAEILLHPIDDPAGGETGGAEPGETRDLYDDVQDYAGLLESPPRDQTGAVIAGLPGYQVAVSVSSSAALGPGGAQVPAGEARRVDVRVTYGSSIDITLSGYRSAD